MHICIVSPDYPTSKTIDFVFVDQLCRAIALKGINVTIIAPQSITKCIIRKIPITKRKKRIYITSDKYFTLIRPKYLTTGNFRGLFKNHNKIAFHRAVRRGYKLLDNSIDVLYGHFWSSVSAAFSIAKDNKIPLIASSGEEFISKDVLGFNRVFIKDLVASLSGVIHVSTNNRIECEIAGLSKDDKSIVIPNAIDHQLFYQRDKEKCREKLNINKDVFLVAFVGQFTHRKGLLRLNNALKILNDKNIKVFFIGKGPEVPDYEGILHCGTIMHDDLPEYLSAADVFVLPTLNEGCCNAIIEAMACGLPIISSDLPFNYDVLNDTNSILIDPMDEDAIASSIKYLKENRKKRILLSSGALAAADCLTLEKRVDKIFSFINHVVDNK